MYTYCHVHVLLCTCIAMYLRLSRNKFFKVSFFICLQRLTKLQKTCPSSCQFTVKISAPVFCEDGTAYTQQFISSVPIGRNPGPDYRTAHWKHDTWKRFFVADRQATYCTSLLSVNSSCSDMTSSVYQCEDSAPLSTLAGKNCFLKCQSALRHSVRAVILV